LQLLNGVSADPGYAGAETGSGLWWIENYMSKEEYKQLIEEYMDKY
jgi:hypothetical protein